MFCSYKSFSLSFKNYFSVPIKDTTAPIERRTDELWLCLLIGLLQTNSLCFVFTSIKYIKLKCVSPLSSSSTVTLSSSRPSITSQRYRPVSFSCSSFITRDMSPGAERRRRTRPLKLPQLRWRLPMATITSVSRAKASFVVMALAGNQDHLTRVLRGAVSSGSQRQ